MQTNRQSNCSDCFLPPHLAEKSEFFRKNPEQAIKAYRKTLWDCIEHGSPIAKKTAYDLLEMDFDERGEAKNPERLLGQIKFLIGERGILRLLADHNSPYIN